MTYYDIENKNLNHLMVHSFDSLNIVENAKGRVPGKSNLSFQKRLGKGSQW